MGEYIKFTTNGLSAKDAKITICDGKEEKELPGIYKVVATSAVGEVNRLDLYGYSDRMEIDALPENVNVFVYNGVIDRTVIGDKSTKYKPLEHGRP